MLVMYVTVIIMHSKFNLYISLLHWKHGENISWGNTIPWRPGKSGSPLYISLAIYKAKQWCWGCMLLWSSCITSDIYTFQNIFPTFFPKPFFPKPFFPKPFLKPFFQNIFAKPLNKQENCVFYCVKYVFILKFRHWFEPHNCMDYLNCVANNLDPCKNTRIYILGQVKFSLEWFNLPCNRVITITFPQFNQLSTTSWPILPSAAQSENLLVWVLEEKRRNEEIQRLWSLLFFYTMLSYIMFMDQMKDNQW